MSFDKIFDLTAGMYFNFYNIDDDTQPVIRAIGVSHTACKDEFRRNPRSHSWSVFILNFTTL